MERTAPSSMPQAKAVMQPCRISVLIQWWLHLRSADDSEAGHNSLSHMASRLCQEHTFLRTLCCLHSLARTLAQITNNRPAPLEGSLQHCAAPDLDLCSGPRVHCNIGKYGSNHEHWALQPLVSRETSPTDSAVVSVSEFNTGAIVML